MRCVVVLCLVLVVSCGDQGSEPEPLSAVAPAEGAMSGYYQITIDVAPAGLSPESIESVSVGPNRAFDLAPSGPSSVVVTVQGAPAAGPADVVLRAEGSETVLEGAFEYTPPLDPRFSKVMAIGASLTQGVQAGTPSFQGGLMSPPAQIARQMGAYMPLPLLVRGLFPPISPTDIGPPPECTVPDVVTFIADVATDVLPKLVSPDGMSVGFEYARVDPEIEVYNLAVGGSTLKDVAQGPQGITASFVTHMVYDPFAPIGSPVEHSQIELVEAAEPSLIISTDLYGNDLILAVAGEGEIDPSKVTPIDDFQADLEALLARLAATGAEVFLANMPRPGILPAAREKQLQSVAAARQAALDNGENVELAASEAQARAEAATEAVDALGAAFNQILADTADQYPNIHVVDMAGEVERLEAEGLIAGDTVLTVEKFGGLLGIDGVHFSDTGYAMLSNLFIETINATLDTQIPAVDLAPIVAADEDTPRALEAGGLDLDACLR